MSKLIDNIAPTIKAARKGEIRYARDPMKPLMDRGLVVQVGRGLFVIKGTPAELLNRIDRLIMNIAERVDAREVSVPSILSLENAEYSGYLHSFADQAMMVRPYLDSKTPEGMASPTVCYHYISSLKNNELTQEQTVTAKAHCVRKERGELADLGRLTNFTMREIISFGTQDYCRTKQEQVMRAAQDLLASVLDLDYQVAIAADPFFGDNETLKKKAQIAFESKHELQARIPFHDSFLAVASSNFHGSVFYDRFNIKPCAGNLPASMCVGFGYERMLYAILAQKGINFSSPYYKKLLR